MLLSKATAITAVILFGAIAAGSGAEPGRVTLRDHVPAAISSLAPKGRLPATNALPLAIGLPLRNQNDLDDLLRQLYDPRSTNFHRFLTPEEFTARFGPTEQDYQAVIQFAEANGLTVTGRHGNRVVLDVAGSVSNIERAFHLTLRTYRPPTETRDVFAPDTEPSVPTNLPVADMWGLTDFGLPHPLVHAVDAAKITPQNYNGSGPSGSYQCSDFRNAYAPGCNLTGSGQTLAVAEFDGYYPSDITAYENTCGYAVPLQNILVDSVTGTPGYSGVANAVAEVSLDIELAVAMAPGLSQLRVYEGSSPYDVFNKIVTDNVAKQISCSWTWNAGPTVTWAGKGTTLDSQLKEMGVQGQSFFQACGDSDAYTGTEAISSSKGPSPVDSIYVTSVGGTSLTMTGTGTSWASETVWNWGGNTGTGGGISPNYTIPSWQASVSMALNHGSTVDRNIPDVALTADAINVLYNNGSTGIFGGTSCAAPLWAGFCALINQQSVGVGAAPVGFLNPALYAIGTGANYTNCFHDVATGNNIGSHTAGLYYATNGYDLATGWGTPNGTNLINTLAPRVYIVTPPASQNAPVGNNVALNVGVGGQPPFDFRWLLNGTNLPAGGNVSGTTGTTLALTSVTTNNSGNYSVVVTNSYGSTTSLVAVLSVGVPPGITNQPAGTLVVAGSNAVFTVGAAGNSPLAYQWYFNATNALTGAVNPSLTVANVQSANAGNYSVVVTNAYGMATSSVAVLSIVFPPGITNQPANVAAAVGNSAVFTVGATGTSPLAYQWYFNTTNSLAGAVNSSLTVANAQLTNAGNYSVIVTNAYGAVTSSVTTLTVGLPPGITNQPASLVVLAGSNAVFTVGAGGNNPLVYQWYFNTTNALAGAVNPSLTITNAQPANAGHYSVIITNIFGAATSSAATLTVGVPPAITNQPASVAVLAGSNAVFTVGASGSSPLAYQWFFNATNALAGATNLSFTLTNAQPTNAGNYGVLVTNTYGSATSTVAALTVNLPPSITVPPTNQTAQCGSNATFIVAATGTPPLTYQWSLDNALITGATNATFSLTNVSLPTHAVAVVVRNPYASATNIVTLTMQDTLPPVISLNSTNPFYLELGRAFVDPGATAFDLCAGSVPAIASGGVNTSAVGTNTVLYTANDGNGNTNTATRTVIVRDTTPPTILSSFTNLTIAAGTNCTAAMPNVTGTNFILATDLSGALTITQSPTNNTVLPLGANAVVITVADVSGNTSYSTNQIIVSDQTPPLIVTQPQSQTSAGGASASFSVTATACTPLAFQWLFNTAALTAQTNNSLTLSNLTLTTAGNYSVVAAASGGSTTSAVAVLTVTVPPGITLPPTNQTAQCGGNVMFIVTATGTAPLSYQWSLDDAAITGATNTTLSLTNVSGAGHSVAIVVANPYGLITNSVTLTVQDTLPPVISLNGANPFYLELGRAFVDPGAMAHDLCAGSVPVTASGAVNTGAVGTNTVLYTSDDGNGNTNTATRTVIVRDTTPPTILSSFTNLTLAVGTNCTAPMPDVTGTNFILATDLSGALTITQNPTNNTTVSLGANIVVITVADASGNTSYSTNQIVVQDQTPPLILTQPQSQTNFASANASFSATATACTPLAFQWFFENSALAAQTNEMLTLSNLTSGAAGNYFVVATAAGGSSTSAVAVLTVNSVVSSVALSSSENPSGFKDTVNFTAALTPLNATGTVQFLTNGTAFDLEPLVAGIAISTNISSLPRGTNLIAAVYSGDSNDPPATGTLAQIVTNHPPVAAPAFYNRLAGYPLNIAVTDLASNWTDADGDTVSLAAIAVSTNGVTVTNNAGTLAYFNPNSVDDQFTCTISDGFGGANFQTVNIAIVLTDTVPSITGIASGSGSGVTLSLGGAPGYTYILQTTTNLFSSGDWIPVATNTLGTNGVWQFTDTQATNFPYRFYRLLRAP